MRNLNGLCMHWIVLTGMDDEKIWEKTQEESEVAAQGESEWPGKENPSHFVLQLEALVCIERKYQTSTFEVLGHILLPSYSLSQKILELRGAVRKN